MIATTRTRGLVKKDFWRGKSPALGVSEVLAMISTKKGYRRRK
jgi:hypothetical protein